MFYLLTLEDKRVVGKCHKGQKATKKEPAAANIAARVYSQMNFATDTQSGVGNKILSHCSFRNTNATERVVVHRNRSLERCQCVKLQGQVCSLSRYVRNVNSLSP